MFQMTGSEVALLAVISLAGLFLLCLVIEKVIKLKVMLSRRASRKVGTIDVTPERWVKLREDVEDILEEGISKKMTDNEWTKEEGAAIKKMFANVYDLKGILPRGQLTLREQLIKRLTELGKLPEKFRQAPAPPPVTKAKSADALKAMFKIN